MEPSISRVDNLFYNISRDTETIRDQLIKNVNKRVLPQVQLNRIRYIGKLKYCKQNLGTIKEYKFNKGKRIKSSQYLC